MDLYYMLNIILDHLRNTEVKVLVFKWVDKTNLYQLVVHDKIWKINVFFVDEQKTVRNYILIFLNLHTKFVS